MKFLNLDYLFRLIYEFITGGQSLNFSRIKDLWFAFIDFVSFPVFLISILSVIGIIYCLFKIAKLNKIELEEYKKIITAEPAGKEKSQQMWEHLENLVSSSNKSDWRQAILEADIILDDMVTSMGYDGETLGEKLKSIEISDFTSLNNAWEAHRFRNRIAHEGIKFEISQLEARRVLNLYRSVFEEFHYI
jgi:hypothetical protein